MGVRLGGDIMTDINTNKASPETQNIINKLVSQLTTAGITFVPIPALNEEDYKTLSVLCYSQLKKLEMAAEND